MPQPYATLDKALIINDEANDSQGQIAPGEEALDGDGFAVLTVVRLPRNPVVTDVRPYGQFWVNTTTTNLFWSRGAGQWYQVRDTVSIPAHAATHLPGGADALPWTAVHGSGLFAARPAAAATNAGFLYDATDTQQLFRSDGSAWVELGVSALAKTYTHSQGVPATGWVVNHNLGRFPSAVSVLDSTNRALLAPYNNVTPNQLVVSFGRATAGSCLVR